MPKRVTVIGAGVVGLCCATRLQMQGHDVTLVDPEPPGSQCSFGNAGCLSRASCVPLGLPGTWKKAAGWLLDRDGPLHVPLRYAPRIAPWLWRFQRSTSRARVEAIADALHALLTTSIDRWRPLAAHAGVPELIVQRGYAFAYESEAAFADDALGRELRRARGVAIDVLTGDAIRAYEPALSERVTHLAVLPEQGHCPNPLRLSQALATRLAEGGARFVARTVRDFDVGRDGVRRVVTDDGTLDTDACVIAAGAQSAALAGRLGARVPLETERGYHAMLASPSVAPRAPIASGEGKYFVTPMEGGVRIAGTVELGGLAAPPDYRRADVLVAKASRLLPGLRGTAVERWMGHRPSLPDSLPVIGRSPAAANAFFAFGHGHVGLTAAAPTGEIIADLVAGRRPSIDIAPFAAERFHRERRATESR